MQHYEEAIRVIEEINRLVSEAPQALLPMLQQAVISIEELEQVKTKLWQELQEQMEQYQHLVTLAAGLGPNSSGGQAPTIDTEELEAKRAEAYQEHAAIQQMTLQFNDLCTRLKEELAKNQHLLHQQ